MNTEIKRVARMAELVRDEIYGEQINISEDAPEAAKQELMNISIQSAKKLLPIGTVFEIVVPKHSPFGWGVAWLVKPGMTLKHPLFEVALKDRFDHPRSGRYLIAARVEVE